MKKTGYPTGITDMHLHNIHNYTHHIHNYTNTDTHNHIIHNHSHAHTRSHTRAQTLAQAHTPTNKLTIGHESSKFQSTRSRGKWGPAHPKETATPVVRVGGCRWIDKREAQGEWIRSGKKKKTHTTYHTNTQHTTHHTTTTHNTQHTTHHTPQTPHTTHTPCHLDWYAPSVP